MRLCQGVVQIQLPGTLYIVLPGTSCTTVLHWIGEVMLQPFLAEDSALVCCFVCETAGGFVAAVSPRDIIERLRETNLRQNIY